MSLNFEKVLTELGIQWKPRTSGSRTITCVVCPYCNGSSSKHKDPYSGALFQTETGLGSWSCWRGCKPEHGGIKQVIKDLSGASYEEINKVISMYSDEIIPPSLEIKRASRINLPRSVGMTSLYENYLRSRGFIPEKLINNFDISFTPETQYIHEKMYWHRRIIFPVYDLNNRLVSYTGRTVDKQNDLRYLFPSAEKEILGAKTIGLRNKNYDQKKPLVVCEGCFDYCKGGSQFLATFGISYDIGIVNTIINMNPSKVYVIFDPKEIKASIKQRELIESLELLVDVSRYKYPFDYDFGDCSLKDIERIHRDLGIDSDLSHVDKDWKMLNS